MTRLVFNLSLTQLGLHQQALAPAGTMSVGADLSNEISNSSFYSPVSTNQSYLAAPFQSAAVKYLADQVPANREAPLGIPRHWIDQLFAASLKANREYSLFRHQTPHGPADYEIREGDEFETDSTTLGGEEYIPVEENFFGTTFVAHIHPLGADPLPSERDLRIIGRRARLRPGMAQTHTVFGFAEGEPSFVQFVARFDPLKNRV